MLPGSVSYHYVNHQYGKRITIYRLTNVGSTKWKFECSWHKKLLMVNYLAWYYDNKIEIGPKDPQNLLNMYQLVKIVWLRPSFLLWGIWHKNRWIWHTTSTFAICFLSIKLSGVILLSHLVFQIAIKFYTSPEIFYHTTIWYLSVFLYPYSSITHLDTTPMPHISKHLQTISKSH